MNFEPNLRVPPPSSNSLEVRSSASGWMSKAARHLSISNKINCGYAIALGIAVLGTTVGVVIGDRYQAEARQQMMIADDTSSVLNALQGALLQVQSHERALMLLRRKPRELQQDNKEFLEHITEAEAAFRELKSLAQTTSVEDLEPLLQKYDGTLKSYFQQLKVLVAQINVTTLKPEQVPARQQLILNFVDGSTALGLDRFSQELVAFGKTVREKQEAADIATGKAAALRTRILTISMLLSVLLAGLLAYYISRSIARPLKVVTHVAQQATREANFDLQAPVTTSDEVGVLAASLNQLIYKVKQLLEEQQAATQTQLMQSEKMSSLGRMMAGVAHEINNPVNFIYGNLVHASEYVEELLALLDAYQTEITNPPETILERAEEIDIEFIKEDLSKVLRSMQVGAERVREIVFSLKNFSRLDEAEAHSVDLHCCIDSTLLILNNRIKKEIAVVRNYGDIPAIEGYASMLYQVFMNLLSNAIDAVEEVKGSGQIVITTERSDKDWVVVKVADNGLGIAPENLAKIFDAFFTTKPRGVGTGLGLAIAHQIVALKHGGRLQCKSEVGIGTEFAIGLPVRHRPSMQQSQPASVDNLRQISAVS